MKKKLLSLFLCCVIVFGLLSAALTTAFSGETGMQICAADWTPVSDVTIREDTKTKLTVNAGTGSGIYQWQIHVGGDVWANIAGANDFELQLGYALVANLLNRNSNTAEIRCRFTNDVGNVTYSNAVTVRVLPAERVSVETPAPGTVVSEATAASDAVITPAAPAAPAQAAPAAPAEEAPAAPAEEAPAESADAAPAEEAGGEADTDDEAPAQEAPAMVAPVGVMSAPAEQVAVPADDTPVKDAPELGTYTIIIKYVFEDGKQAANPWSATVATGSTYVQDITSPVVVGYAPDKTVVHVDAAAEATYTVTYQPAEVGYTVKLFPQNTTNDDYTLHSSVPKTGLTNSPVGEGLGESIDGFTTLLYDTSTKIAADGSTEVKIYYDRNYYLMSFDLDGGYGVEPVYARYGAPVSVGVPTKAGYTFAGWDKEIPSYMPAHADSFKAQWTIGDKAKVTVVVWGENADWTDSAVNKKYSFIKNDEIQAEPETKLTKDDLENILTCDKEEHNHLTDGCTFVCTHTHSLACYGLRNNAGSTNPNDKTASWCDSKPETYFAQLGLEDGYLYYDDENAALSSKDNYYLRLNGKYYKLNENQFNKLKGTEVGQTSDNTRRYPDYYYKYTVNESGMSCTHQHTDACYGCGKAEHTHNSGCYYSPLDMDGTLWKYVKSDEITVAADGTSIINVYYDRVEFTLHFRDAYSSNDDYGTIKAKWGANIREAFNQKCKDAGTSNWSEKESARSPWTTYLDIMPTEGRTYYAYKEGYGTSTAYYYVEGLDGKDTLFYEDKSTGSGYTVTVEEFIEISGFTFNPDRSSKVGDNFNGAKFYYTRNSYNLKFYNHNGEIEGSSKTVKYEAPLSVYNFTPDYPAGLEPNAYAFAGWYTTADCFPGSEADLSKMTMPASDVILYAKWTPKTHTVDFYKTAEDMKDNYKLSGEEYKQQTVAHGARAVNVPDPENGNYNFVGWFYTDESGAEKAFDIAHMPVDRDLKLYGKWRSDSLVEYTIRYQLEDGTEIAPPTTGSALAGTTKTFDAKTGSELNTPYQSGYFPEVGSHSLTMNIDGGNEFTFVYVAKAEVTYIVKYLEKGTGNVLADPKTVATSNAVVTENFKQIAGYAPDAYQKRLVLAADGNEIIFWYVKDDVHAPVQVIHWKQNIEGDGYTEYQSSTDLNGVIGRDYSETPLTIAGFEYNAEKSNASGTLTAAGLVLNLYYDRTEYPYEFRFLEQGTDNELAESVTGSARFEKRVSQNAKDIPGYTLVSANTQYIDIAVEAPADTASRNVKTFYYAEQTVEIKYAVVGPTGCGTLDNYQEAQLKVTTGTVKGSTPTAAEDFEFVGWYKDEACTQAVDESWVVSGKITPAQTKNIGGTAEAPVMAYEAATYYAKFEWDVADLTIVKSGCEVVDENQSFMFLVYDNEKQQAVRTVVINGNGSVTITGLKVGSYTVTELTAWSWRYRPDSLSQTIDVKPDMSNVVFSNSRTNQKWLGGDAYVQNKLG